MNAKRPVEVKMHGGAPEVIGVVMTLVRISAAPEPVQEQALLGVLSQCRDLYNAALEQRVTAYKQQGRSITSYEQQTELTRLRESDAAWKAGSVHAQRSALDPARARVHRLLSPLRSGREAGFPTVPLVAPIAWLLASERGVVDAGEGPQEGSPPRAEIGHMKVNLYRPIGGEIRK